MTWFSSLGARRLALLAVLFVIGVACAKVERDYDDSSSAGSGGEVAGASGSAGSGKAGSASGGQPGAAGEAGAGGEATAGEGGSAGETAAGAGGVSNGTLTVVMAGTGKGVVTSDIPGIDCDATCSADFDPDTQVVLSATADTSSTFTGWSGGGCTGTGTCTVSTADANEVTATFMLNPTLKVTKAGTGIGTVTSTPTGINCGTDCSEVIDYGGTVRLTATTTAGTVFTGWSGGGCSGTGTCAVTMTAATEVTATFTCSGTTTLDYSGAITTFTVPACVTALTIDAYGAQGGNAGSFLGGYGARMKGTVSVTGGSTLRVLVGGKGLDAFDTAQQAGGSGGGGTFVVNASNQPLMVAGGGGGAMNYTPSWTGAGLGGTTTTAGLAATSGNGIGGTAGGGGTTPAWTGWHTGTGGGGLTGNGINNTTGSTTAYGSPYTPGMAFINGGTGGQPGSCGTLTTCITGRPGGFGGGGAAGFTGGGGGGYSGGGGGDFNSGVNVASGGGGGGSYNAGTAQTNTAATRAGNGMVIFTY